MSYPILKNAPITEALIDIRVKLPSGTDIKSVDSIYESIKNQYPEKQKKKLSQINFESETGLTINPSDPKTIGYHYISADKKQIMQARLDGFTFSRLHPYTNWEALRDEAHKLWKIYKKVTSPEAITRIALRYINNLNIPMPIKDFGDHLTSPPIIPEGLPQGIGSFLTRVVIREPSLSADAIIIQVLDKIDNDVAPVILDIDVFRYRPDGIEEKEGWELIEKLRHLKNKIFFTSITNSLQEMYK